MTKKFNYDKITLLYNDIIFRLEVDDIRNSNETTNLILSSALDEFLQVGFEKASVRTIAKNADVTTGALYARFSNKDALFGALVEPVISKFLAANDEGNKLGFDNINSGKAPQMWSNTQNSSSKILNLVYENKDIFTLLINCSNGSSYENFIDQVVEIEEKETLEVLGILKEKGYCCQDVSPQVVHMLISAHCYALFEVVRHDLTKSDAVKQVNQINEFFICGWNKIFGI